MATGRGMRSKQNLSVPSRTRLAKDLKPKSLSRARGVLEVAPRQQSKRFIQPSRNGKKIIRPKHDSRSKGRDVLDRMRGNGEEHIHGARHVDFIKGPEFTRPPRHPKASSSSNLMKRNAISSRVSTSLDRPVLRLGGNQDRVDDALSGFLQAPQQNSPVQLPNDFTSPPLMPGLLTSLRHVLGPSMQPTPIQALSLKHLFSHSDGKSQTENATWKQFLLASETGTGKSIAYLLPVLQDLKQTELQPESSTSRLQRRDLNPRAVILAPTHELSRQLATFAKALLHIVKLRVLCASRSNLKNSNVLGNTASKMAKIISGVSEEFPKDEIQILEKNKRQPVDIIVGTPSRLLEMIRGRGWNREGEKVQPAVHGRDVGEQGTQSQVSSKRSGYGDQRLGLENVEWVVADEADVLFDSDFQETTRLLLADISEARGHNIETPLSASSQSHGSPLEYPFNFLLASATIPSSLASYLDTYHPSLTRLASPNLHNLPVGLKPEYVSWTGGNRNADIEKRIKRIWMEESLKTGKTVRSKVLVFCNKNSRVEDLGKYLTARGVPNIALTSTSDTRKRGSNHHLDGFLRRPVLDHHTLPHHSQLRKDSGDTINGPDVMITTSLLSRGLDFAPIVKYVFIVDEPRNMVDFLHRAGRTGRAGQRGKVVLFGKLKGRQSARSRKLKNKVTALAG